MYSYLGWSALLAFALGLVGTFVVVKFMRSKDNVDEGTFSLLALCGMLLTVTITFLLFFFFPADITIFKDNLKYVDILVSRLRMISFHCQRSNCDSLMVFFHR